MTNPNLGRKVGNRNKVPKKQWTKWNNHARRVFNDVHKSFRHSMQSVLVHPDATIMKREHWGTLRWNAAWLAAEAAQGKGYVSKVTEYKSRAKK